VRKAGPQAAKMAVFVPGGTGICTSGNGVGAIRIHFFEKILIFVKLQAYEKTEYHIAYSK
jgi:hypothetical protein